MLCLDFYEALLLFLGFYCPVNEEAMQKAAFIFVGTELSGNKAKRNVLPFLIFHGETLESISLETFLTEDLIEQMILFGDLLGWDVGCLQRPFHQRMQKSQPTGRTSQSRDQEIGEIPSA